MSLRLRLNRLEHKVRPSESLAHEERAKRVQFFREHPEERLAVLAKALAEAEAEERERERRGEPEPLLNTRNHSLDAVLNRHIKKINAERAARHAARKGDSSSGPSEGHTEQHPATQQPGHT